MIDPEAWNLSVLKYGPRSGRFLQSWEWGEFQRSMGENVHRQMIEYAGDTVGMAQWVERTLPGLGSYGFCPKGPIFFIEPRSLSPNVLLTDFSLFQMAIEKHLTFFRMEPVDTMFTRGTYPSVRIHPESTSIVDLSLDEGRRRSKMHPKTRYNIGVAKRHGVTVERSSDHLEAVWPLFQETSARDHFRLHPMGYYKQMLHTLRSHACRASLATASFGDMPLAAVISVDFGDTRTYLHGASSSAHRSFMAPYLLHWELMQDAKARGMRWYDWWGVAPLDANPFHPWAGISKFKRNFGGEDVVSPGTFDLPLRPARYALYASARCLFRAVHRLKRMYV